MRYQSVAVLALAATTAACGWRRTPVPVTSETGSVEALVGNWSGEYSSAETGRNGSITFTLAPYNDPECGCRVITTFSGRFADANTIEGTYDTRGTSFGHTPSGGKWKVTRQTSTHTDSSRQ